MKSWVRKTLSVGVLAAGALLFAPGAAHADVHADTHDNNGFLNGTQLVAPINIPLNIVGNAIGVAGEANAAGAVQNRTEGAWGPSVTTHDNNGIANGTQAYLPINVPVNVVGNSLAVLGAAQAAGSAVNGHSTESATVTEKGHGHRPHGGGADVATYDNNGFLNGTQIYAPIDIPINVCGNSLGLLGAASSQAVCANGGGWGRSTESTHVDRVTTHDNNGFLNGTQLYAPINLPVNLAGNAIGVLGFGQAAAQVVNESAHVPARGVDTHDNNGFLNGTQIALPINAPVNVCGNALGILGAASAQAACGDLVGGVQGDHGGQGHHGHKPGGNAGDNGDDDYMGNGGAQGGDDNGYGGQAADNGYGGQAPATGSDSGSTGGRSATEASAVDNLTKAAGGVGSVGLGGLDVLNTLR
jgi:hypothetical protein